MTKNTGIDVARPSVFSPDPLMDALRQGARALLTKAVPEEETEFIDPIAAGKLAALIGVEYLWSAVLGPCLFQRLNTKIRVHTIGQPPRQHLVTVPIHPSHGLQANHCRAVDRHQI